MAASLQQPQQQVPLGCHNTLAKSIAEIFRTNFKYSARICLLCWWIPLRYFLIYV
jgi:hypothetical protein